MPGWVKNRGLLLVNFGLFAVFFIGMAVTGFATYNQDRTDHGRPAVAVGEYLTSGDFGEATFENWESEFLQMGMYIVLTAFLFQKGSSESKPVGTRAPQDADPREHGDDPAAPWPVRRGGWVLVLYENSLSALFFVLLAGSIVLHAVTGAHAYSEEQSEHGGQPVSALEYVGTSQFWFESFQNWQSEFLAIGIMVGASVYLRQRGSAESKPVATPHMETSS